MSMPQLLSKMVRFFLVAEKILLESLRVGRPVLSRTVECVYVAVHGHPQVHPRHQS